MDLALDAVVGSPLAFGLKAFEQLAGGAALGLGQSAVES